MIVKCAYLYIVYILFILFSDSFSAKVIGIIDGDTIEILTGDNHRIRIRLEGIDCPESNQDFGNKAKQITSELCYKRTVTILKTGKDQYDRMLGIVYVGDICLNKELLRLGMAWHYKEFNNDKEFERLEIDARGNNIGLWSQLKPIAPWDWRHN